MRTLAALVLTACALAPAPAAAADWFFEGDAGVVYETNVGLAQRARDVKSDSALSTSVSTGLALPLGDDHLFTFSGDVNGNGYVELPGLSNLGIGATAAFRTKFGLGASAPWLRLFASGTRLEYDDAVRDAWRYRLGAGGGLRLGERWDVRLDYVFEERMADHGHRVSRILPGDVFDITSHTYSARLDVAVNEVLTVFGGYALREGDVVSTTRRNAAILAASTALTTDRPFGPDFVAYKIDATVHILSFGLSFALGRHASLNLGYERQLGFGRRDQDYFNDVFRAGVPVSY
ncbi:MAG: hypothetical protein FJZ38_21710 [Candidatus Rokubacteria bacterium]|nr:hypothetical protein [Candidatus Rokubacteria bacterium]